MAVDMFLKIDGIDGGSVAAKYEKWIEVLSFSWGVSNATSSEGGTTAKLSARKSEVSDFSILKVFDSATPKLFEAACHGGRHSQVLFEMRKSGGEQQEFLKIKLEDVLISGVQSSGNTDLPTESVSFSFASSLISSFDDRGQATTVSTCGAASFNAIVEGK